MSADTILQHITSYLPEALHVPVYFCLFNIVWTWLAAEVTGNASQVDRIWTFLPPIYSIFFTILPLLSFAPMSMKAAGFSPRVAIMAFLQVLWMYRLSYNTWRRGLFRLHDEDYRWHYLRLALPGFLFKIFNLVFIATIQNILLFGLGLPAYFVLCQERSTIDKNDILLSVAALAILLIEFTADNQQYSFQTFKHSKPRNLKPVEDEWFGARIRWTEADAKRGFVSRGLWGWSRHPNFAAEQTFWWIMCLFPVLTGPNTAPALATKHISALYKHSTLVHISPAIALSCLFIGSTLFTESISRQNYPITYGAYQKRVDIFFPFLTPIRGMLLSLLGKRNEIDRLVWGSAGTPGRNGNGKVE